MRINFAEEISVRLLVYLNRFDTGVGVRFVDTFNIGTFQVSHVASLYVRHYRRNCWFLDLDLGFMIFCRGRDDIRGCLHRLLG